jgi:hypothetical protein
LSDIRAVNDFFADGEFGIWHPPNMLVSPANSKIKCKLAHYRNEATTREAASRIATNCLRVGRKGARFFSEGSTECPLQLRPP